MAELNKLYKCKICGNLVSVIEAGKGELVCCGQPMDALEEKTIEQEGNEKHVPVLEAIKEGIRVKVGSVPHPMEDDHYIEVIQLVKNGRVILEKRLNPGDEPVADFCCLASAEGLKAKILCNRHGLWKN